MLGENAATGGEDFVEIAIATQQLDEFASTERNLVLAGLGSHIDGAPVCPNSKGLFINQ